MRLFAHKLTAALLTAAIAATAPAAGQDVSLTGHFDPNPPMPNDISAEEPLAESVPLEKTASDDDVAYKPAASSELVSHVLRGRIGRSAAAPAIPEAPMIAPAQGEGPYAGEGGYDQGGYDQGGYDQGGYEQGGYEQGLDLGCGCDDCGGDCEGGCQHRECYVYTRYEALFLDRENGDRVDFASFGRVGPGGPIALTSGNIDFEYEAFSKFTVGIPLNLCGCLDFCADAVEVSYFGMQNFEDSLAIVSPGNNLFSAFSGFGLNPPFADVDGANLVQLDYTSHLDNAEINFLCLHRQCGKRDLWLMHGIRYTRIQESVEFRARTVADSSLTRVRTDNDMIGYQLGARADITGCCLRVSLEGKAGVFANLAEQQTDTNATVVGVFNETFRDDDVAMVTDLALTGTYDLCCWLAFRAGYYVMYIDGVALATENFNPVAPASAQRVAALDENGSIYMHGATLGLEARW